MLRRTASLALGALMVCASAVSQAHAATIAAPFDAHYLLNDLGAVPGVSTSYGGVTFKAGDANTLLIGGLANQAGGAIYQIGVTRDANNHITGFSGPSSVFATAPNIDGGLAYGPDGVLFYTGYSTNVIGQIKPGSSSPDKIIDLSLLGIGSSTGTLQFVPAGFANAGAMKIASFNGGGWYSATLTPDGTGTFNIGGVAHEITVGGGPEGIVYIPAGNDQFSVDSVLISHYNEGKVKAWDIDANGDPIFGTSRDFITGLSGVEGAAIDPLTGDFIFSTFGGNDRVIVVQGFEAPPTTVPAPAAVWGGVALMAMLAGRRR